ncbi:MipA/OmpV family protein [Massilia sp. CCM 8733]|uniref:MipA/OmpV family protein n=1 Tax=Massilia mucilaginosa TaxID=2609282 RepID=A0ABX0NRN4_9BURK|nr:MipA/OmpV family protein [Massilia mucilaginosa]NHZ89434.1 MipA/OmpV family protein [Massilia mucilaginosa]
MRTLFALALAGAVPAAWAQTPASNPMPDGSSDMYVGLGAVSAPRYQGSGEHRVTALPLVQVQWSNGVFISGMSAGLHLSSNPVLEYGPMLAVLARRSHEGSYDAIGVPLGSLDLSGTQNKPATPAGGTPTRPSVAPPAVDEKAPLAGQRSGNRLAGTEAIGARLQGGVFFNYYLTPTLRVTNNLLAGSGRDRHGASWTVGLQHVTRSLAPHHSVSLAADLTMVNRSYNQSYFGVSLRDTMNSGNMPYAPGGGLRDVAVSARWNWALSPGWMISSGARAARLQGDARRSPLVERANNITVSTGLAYRF